MYIYIYVYLHIRTHLSLSMCVYIYTYIYIYIYVYMYIIYIYIYIYICSYLHNRLDSPVVLHEDGVLLDPLPDRDEDVEVQRRLELALIN